MGDTVRPLRALMALSVPAEPPLGPPPRLPMAQETHFSSVRGHQSLPVDGPDCDPASWVDMGMDMDLDMDLPCRQPVSWIDPSEYLVAFSPVLSF